MIDERDIRRYLSSLDLTCARCDKKLNSFEVFLYNDGALDQTLRIILKCHGASDIREEPISRHDMYDGAEGFLQILKKIFSARPFEQTRLAEAGGLF